MDLKLQILPAYHSENLICLSNFGAFDKSKSEATSSSNKPELGKSEVAAAGSTGSLMGSADSSFKEVEWSVLYTAQLIQKAKKFHDGVIRLVQAGPNVKQVSNQRSVLNGHANLRFFYWMKKVECLAPDISIQVNLLNVERDVSFLIILSKSLSSEIK